MILHIAALVTCSCLMRKVHGADGVMYGNPPISGRTLTVEPRAFILTHKPLPAGRVDYFWFTSSGVNRKLYLQVWRPLGEEQEFLLVGQTFYQTVRNATVQVTVPDTSPAILTEAGDLLGFTSIDKDVGVTFTIQPFDEGSLLRTMVVEGIPVPGQTYSFGGSFFDKRFALSVHITQGVPVEGSCEQDNGGCDHLCSMFNGIPNCRCLTGFNLQLDLLTCSDVDECREDPLVCGLGATCINTAGSYTCAPTQPIPSTVDTTTRTSSSGVHTGKHPSVTYQNAIRPTTTSSVEATSQKPSSVLISDDVASAILQHMTTTSTPTKTQTAGTVTGRGVAALFTDPVMLTVHVWLLLLTLLIIATLVGVCVTWRRRVKFVYGSNLSHHLRNPNNLTTSLDRVSVDKEGRH